jgi:glycine/D-amino acid oxidase-like deaminating enzyme
MLSTLSFDCAVIGAGVIGSATAYHLARLGKRTVLIEQVTAHIFGCPH